MCALQGSLGEPWILQAMVPFDSDIRAGQVSARGVLAYIETTQHTNIFNILSLNPSTFYVSPYSQLSILATRNCNLLQLSPARYTLYTSANYLQYQKSRFEHTRSCQARAPMISTADSALLQLHFTTGSEWASSNATASSSPKASLRWLMNLFDKRQNGSQQLTN